MRVPFLAAVASAACLLSACGFVAPTPPLPPDDNRVAINQADPRLPTIVRPSSTPTQLPQPEPIRIASAAPVSNILTGKTSATPASSAPSDPPTAPVEIPAAKSPAAPGTSIPIPAAPPKVDAPIASAKAQAEPEPGEKPSAPVLVATADTVSTAAQGVLPEAQPPAPAPSASHLALPPAPTAASVDTQATAAVPRAIPVVDIAPAPPAPTSEPVVPKEVWRITPEDGTVRQALTRWAAKANWTFGPDQWELPFDIPVQAAADFEATSFQEATQALSQAIAMTESPIRPCFYGNRVLRMVSFNRSCNRAPAAQS